MNEKEQKLLDEAEIAFDKLDNNDWVRALDRYFYTIGFKNGHQKGLEEKTPLPSWVVFSWFATVPLMLGVAYFILGLTLNYYN